MHGPAVGMPCSARRRHVPVRGPTFGRRLRIGWAGVDTWAVNRATVGAVAGVVAAGVALAGAEVVALLTGPQSSPLTAVGAVVIDGAPEPVVRFGISVFGRYDKIALLIGTLLLLAAAAAGLGVLGMRRLWLGLAGLAGFTVVGIAAAMTRHDAAPTAAAPTLVGALAAAMTFIALRGVIDAADRAQPSGAPSEAPPPEAPGEAPPPEASDQAQPAGEARPPDQAPPPVAPQPAGATASRSHRRDFIRLASVVLGGAAVAGFAARWWGTRRHVDAARSAVTLPSPIESAPPVPAGADLAVPGLASYVTGNDDFYRIDTALVVPRVDPDDWRLVIHGRVRHPYEISFAELLQRPMLERYITLACVSNPVGGGLIGNARWLGVPVAELLAQAQPLPGADQVVSRSADGWTCGTPTEVLTDGRDALLAVGMNGEPLPVEHGFPVRMVVPGLYGYVSACKWITEIELSSFEDYDAYWVPRGWAPRAPIKTQSRIDTPRRQAAAGQVTVAGVAWAQHRGIARVEVQVDDGPWHEATLADTVSADTWRQWSWRWQTTPGRHRLAVRATDTTGTTQPAEPSPVAPDGATGWHTVEVEVS